MAQEKQNPVHVPHAASSKVQQKESIYQAEYLGSGTFVISKPKRKKNKIRQAKLKNPERGSRK